MHCYVSCSIIYNSQDMEAAQCPLIDEWIKKMWCVYTHTHTHIYIYKHIYIHTYIHTYSGILLSHKKEWNLAICNIMDGSRGYDAKWNNSSRERSIPHDFTNLCNLRNKTNEQGKTETNQKPDS